MELTKMGDRYHVRVTRGTIIRLSLLFVVVAGFGVGMGVSLVVSDLLTNLISEIQNNKAMVRSAAAMAVDNEKELQVMRSRCSL